MNDLFPLAGLPAEEPGIALVQAAEGARWRLFRDPLAIVRASRVEEVRASLAAVIDAVDGQGVHAAGFIAYEAAPAFDDALPARPADDQPLLWFGLYQSFQELPAAWPASLSDGQDADLASLSWQPAIAPDEHARAVAAIKDAIARGDTYQVNFTFPLRAAFDGDPRALFRRMLAAQRCRYAAFIDTGRHVICSASPELFWALDGERLTVRPMKGTAARGRTLDEDEAQRAWLYNSAKNRAENVMIVDMLRNDLGRIARYGTVQTPALFTTERYPTVWQMTSTVECQTGARADDILGALFPCASITGAPKVRTMQIIQRLEQAARGVYTGCIGVISPGRQAQFSVAIRTVVVDRHRREAVYGVGGGVVWDSEPGAEYEEALLKARVLTRAAPPFELLETLRWTANEGFYLLERHLQRLAASATYFDMPLATEQARQRLAELAKTFDGRPQRVRLLLAQDGALHCEASPLEPGEAGRVWRVGLASQPVDIDDPFLYHKTTQRAVYAAARASRPDCDDTLLWNRRGELTESTIANVVIQREGSLVTPPVDSGLLGGVLRAELLASGVIDEAVVKVNDLQPGDRLWLINSLRGWMEAILVGPASGELIAEA